MTQFRKKESEEILQLTAHLIALIRDLLEKGLQGKKKLWLKVKIKSLELILYLKYSLDISL